MKAAVLNQYGENPKYTDFTDPIPNADEVLVEMLAASIKQIDKLKASGKHYTTYPALPAVVGLDGVATLKDGTHIYFSNNSGTIAERALVVKDNWTVVPKGLSGPLAAALPNALLGSDAAMLYRGNLKEGDTVMINGATGATGRVAIQMAKNRGANRVIAVGRLSSGLSELSDLGADILINTEQGDEAFIEELSKILKDYHPQVVIDYLWGRPTELVLEAMNDLINIDVKFVTVGEMAGATVNLSSGLLRSRKIELLGSGIGGLSLNELTEYNSIELPIAYQWALEGKIVMPIHVVELADIETAWQAPQKRGERTIVML